MILSRLWWPYWYNRKIEVNYIMTYERYIFYEVLLVKRKRIWNAMKMPCILLWQNLNVKACRVTWSNMSYDQWYWRSNWMTCNYYDMTTINLMKWRNICMTNWRPLLYEWEGMMTDWANYVIWNECQVKRNEGNDYSKANMMKCYIIEVVKIIEGQKPLVVMTKQWPIWYEEWEYYEVKYIEYWYYCILLLKRMTRRRVMILWWRILKRMKNEVLIWNHIRSIDMKWYQILHDETKYEEGNYDLENEEKIEEL